MSKVNVDKLYFAIQTQDDTQGLVYQTPEYIPGVQQIDAKVKVNTDKNYAEGIIWEQENTTDEITIEMDLAELSSAQYAKFLGHTVSANGGVYASANDKAPYIAILFQATKGNGKKAFRVFYKGKLTEPSENAKAREGKTDYQNHKVEASFQTCRNNGMWVYKIDEDDPNTPAGIANTFFTNVIVPTADTTIPTLTSTTPANNATTVAVSTTFSWLFSEAIAPSCVTADHFIVAKDTDGSLVAGTLSQSADKLTVIFTPSANLTAATAYRAICTSDVIDLAGNKLAATQIKKFTTA